VTDTLRIDDGTVTVRRATDESFEVLVGDDVVGSLGVSRTDAHTADLSWALEPAHRGRGLATRALRMLVDLALTETGEGGLGYTRVEAHVPEGDERAVRVATRSGLRREGVRRGARGTHEAASYVVLARLRDDPPLSDPGAFRALLNSFLPRKRAIGQLLVRDGEGRVLLCGLTYKQDWDLPGGVVEVGESPQVAVGREVTEELALDLPPGRLLLTDWLPPWSGWDDALCLVFDGGVHDPSLLDAVVRQEREIREVAFCTLTEVHERCADFTARRVEAALAALANGGAAYTESGRRV
jgi:ADP-ribose pyrophosphatase YjhB (NUDIX family)/GNAT superfamily N-acetyltransferase